MGSYLKKVDYISAHITITCHANVFVTCDKTTRGYTYDSPVQHIYWNFKHIRNESSFIKKKPCRIMCVIWFEYLLNKITSYWIVGNYLYKTKLQMALMQIAHKFPYWNILQMNWNFCKMITKIDLFSTNKIAYIHILEFESIPFSPSDCLLSNYFIPFSFSFCYSKEITFRAANFFSLFFLKEKKIISHHCLCKKIHIVLWMLRCCVYRSARWCVEHTLCVFLCTYNIFHR